MRSIIGVVGLALLSASGCAKLADREPVPEGWVAFDTGCGFHFYAPPETTAMTAPGIDSCVATYATAKCAYDAEVGEYAEQPESLEPEQREETTRVNSRTAKLVGHTWPNSEFPEVATLYIAADRAAETPAVSFTAGCRTLDDLQLPRRIFQTIELDQ